MSVSTLPSMTLPMEKRVRWWTRWRLQIDRCLTVIAVGAVVWFFGWTVHSSDSLRSPAADEMYNLLTRGYRKGHLHLDRAPPAELVALADPYDPAVNGPFRLPDASYFRGHYY